MRFTKMQGCGNDYIYVNMFSEQIGEIGETARMLSDRHFGIGGDGMVLIAPSETADFKMLMYNADGSEGAMCGNAIRCVGKYVYDHKMTDKTSLEIETKSGIRHITLHVENGAVRAVTADMGHPVLIANQIPVVTGKEKVIDEPIRILDQEWKITCISMGNPHAVVFVDDTDALDLQKIGPLFEHHEIFPDRVNTEFVSVTDRKNLRMRVWERGSGETMACGTGACASAMAGILTGRTDSAVTVHLRGGALKIAYDAKRDTIEMTGPAEVVFEGNVEL